MLPKLNLKTVLDNIPSVSLNGFSRSQSSWSFLKSWLITSRFDSISIYSAGKFSCVRGGIILTRRIGHFLIKKYIPSFLIVTMSFVGFWIPTDSYPARIVLTVTSLLALITQEIETSAEINASYVVALNVWMIICISFVFLAIVEFGFAMLHFHKNLQVRETYWDKLLVLLANWG